MTDITDPTKPVAIAEHMFNSVGLLRVDVMVVDAAQLTEGTPLYGPSLLSEYERVKAERDEQAAWITEATKTITNAIGGGSEMFRRHGEAFRVDPAYVATFIQSRRDDHRNSIAEAIRGKKEAVARSEALEAEVKRLREAFVLPQDVIESLLAIGPVEWGVSLTQSDEKHASDLLDTLRLTREHFDMPVEETGIHGVYLEGTGTVLAHTGMSPNSPQHARILAGAWNQLVDMARTLEASK